MTFIKVDYTDEIKSLILQRQHKTTIQGMEIILPKHGYKMTYKERQRKAQKEAEQINNLILN